MSTNTVLLDGDYPIGTVCATVNQTAGRGRSGRSWEAASGDSLAYSLQLPLMSTAQLMGAQIVAGFAVVESLLPWLDARLKWPNDLVYAGKKLAGLLIETQFAGNTLKKAIFGVGINIKAVNPALKERAIAIKDINSGADIDIHHFIESLSKQLDEKLELYLAGELDITSSWAQYSANYMKTISIHINGQKTGVVEAGITERGYLKTADGAIITDGEIGYDFGI